MNSDWSIYNGIHYKSVESVDALIAFDAVKQKYIAKVAKYSGHTIERIEFTWYENLVSALEESDKKIKEFLEFKRK